MQRLSTLVLVIAALAGCAATESATAETKTAPPNIIFILADDLGYGELGSFGQKKIRTPHLDALATQGMRLTRHYSGSPVCAPSRCVLMTGKHPGHAFIRNNSEHKPEGQGEMPPSETVVASLLAKKGYTTGAFGKWGLGFPGSTSDPMNTGFDRFFGYNCQRVAHSYYPPHLWSDRAKVMLDNNPPVPGHATLPKDLDANDPASYDRYKGTDYAPDRINKQVLEFISANKDKPFFCYYPTIIPHVALHVPDEELEPYKKLGWKETPFTRRNQPGYTPHHTPKAAYAAMITRMDRYIGNVLNTLDELGIADNTIVIFSSDNGATHLPEVNVKFFNSSAGLRGLKGSVYEGGLRVPTIIRWPGRVKAGSSNDYTSGFEDWMPTFLELAGASDALPKQADGVSLLPTIVGKNQPQRDFLYREFHGYGGQQAVWMGKYKAVRQKLHKGKDALTIELYDLSKDPAESNDIAAKHPDIVAKMRKIMIAEHEPSERFAIKPIDAEKAAATSP